MLHFGFFQLPVCCHFSGFNIYSLYVTIQSFAPVNIYRFVELSAVIILCDDGCCLAVDMVLIFFLPQWCVCVCVCACMYLCKYICRCYICVFLCVCIINYGHVV
jgi:hypothetical protein